MGMYVGERKNSIVGKALYKNRYMVIDDKIQIIFSSNPL